MKKIERDTCKNVQNRKSYMGGVLLRVLKNSRVGFLKDYSQVKNGRGKMLTVQKGDYMKPKNQFNRHLAC